MHLPPLQLAVLSFAARKSTTSFQQTQRYSVRQILHARRSRQRRGSGNQYSKRGCVLQYPYRASPLSPHTNHRRPIAPVRFRTVHRPSGFSLPSWRAWLLSPRLFRSPNMSSNTLNPNSQDRRPSIVRQASVAPDSSKTRQEVTKKQLRATHFNAMVTHSVNKTALHPGGVEYEAATTFEVHD